MPPRHSVITGIGVVSAAGVGFEHTWNSLLQAKHSLARIARFNPDGFHCHVGGEVANFSAKDYVPKSYRKAVKVMARDTELAVAAAKLATTDASFITRGSEDPAATPTYPPDRVGCHIGAGLIAAETQELTSALVTAVTPDGNPAARRFDLRAWGTIDDPETPGAPRGGMGNLQPLWMLKYLPNMLACHVTIIHGAEGPSNTITCAEASGQLSIGESMRVIERGDADACFSGGAESKLSVMGVLRMSLASRLAHIKIIDPDLAPVAPYAGTSVGAVPGEAGAIIILEESSAAKARGARPYARLVGYGASQSPGPCVPPATDTAARARGMELAIKAALRDAQQTAGITIDDIDLIVPQACCQHEADAAELQALIAALGAPVAARAAIVPLVPFLGDCSAGNGGVQVAVAAMCLREQTLPALPDIWQQLGATPFTGLNLAPRETGPAKLRAALVCTSSQGGQNAAIVLAAPDFAPDLAPRSSPV